MEHDPIHCFSQSPELRILPYDQDKALAAVESGDVVDVSMSCKMPVDNILHYALDTGLFRGVLDSFPDHRKHHTVPLEPMLLAKIIRSLNDENSLVSAPYALNDSSLMAKLGYNYTVIEEGFNDMNTHKRQTPYDGDTLRHFLNYVGVKPMLDWFNTPAAEAFRKEAPGRTQTYLMDGMKIHVPAHLVDKFQGAGRVKNSKGEWEYGYKVVWIYQLIDRKGLIVGMRTAPINRHDVELAKELVEGFDFGDGAVLIMDRGFWDFGWLRSLKEERGIDICIPMKKNFLPAVLAAENTMAEHPWLPHPTRNKQEVRKMSEDELAWDECPVFKSGVVVRFKNGAGETEHVCFVHTREGLEVEGVLETYNLRSEIEEMHRQVKLYQGIENLKWKKYPFVVFHVLMGAVAYNLFTLFLNSEGCDNLRDYTLKLMRQKKNRYEKNPEMVVYAKDCFGIMRMRDFLVTILGLPEAVRERLAGVFGGFRVDDAYF